MSINEIDEKIRKLEDEKHELMHQEEEARIFTMKTKIESVICYKLYHYYKPADYNWGDYEAESYYYSKEPKNITTTLVYVPEKELGKYIDKIIYN